MEGRERKGREEEEGWIGKEREKRDVEGRYEILDLKLLVVLVVVQ